MFYAANTLAGALWETALRYVLPDVHGRVLLESPQLTGLSAIQLRLTHNEVPLLELGQPGLRRLFPLSSDESVAVAALIAEPDHSITHPEVASLLQQLQAHGINDMPMLSWPSRQHSACTVYLAYQPPMHESWWDVAAHPIDLAHPDGHNLILDELAKAHFSWIAGDTSATEEES